MINPSAELQVSVQNAQLSRFLVKKIKIISHESQITVNYFSSTSRKFSLKKVIKKYNRFHFRLGGKSSSVIGGDAAQVREGSGVKSEQGTMGRGPPARPRPATLPSDHQGAPEEDS